MTYYLQKFIENQDLSSLTKSEVVQLEELILNAVAEEADTPKGKTCRLQYCISSYVPSQAVLAILKKNNISFIQGQYYSYLEWSSGLLTHTVN